MKAFLARGGHFALSDDSHGVDQVGAKYREVIEFAEKIGTTTITYFEKSPNFKDDRFSGISERIIKLADLKDHPFFD